MTAPRFNVVAVPRMLYGWLQKKTGCALTTDFNAIAAVDANGHVRGMVGYCNWTKTAVQMHMAVETPIAWRALLRPGLEYPFVQEGRDVALGIIPAGNSASVWFAEHVGFQEVHRVRDGWSRGEDLVMLELRKHDCRWLKKKEVPCG